MDTPSEMSVNSLPGLQTDPESDKEFEGRTSWRIQCNSLPRLKQGDTLYEANDFINTPFSIMKQRFEGMSHPVIWGLTQKVPAQFRYDSYADPTLLKAAQHITAEKYFRIISKRDTWIRNLQLPKYDDGKETYLKFLWRLRSYAQVHYLNDMELKTLFWSTLQWSQIRELQLHQVNQGGKYSKFLTAERLFFISYIIYFPINCRWTAVREYFNYNQGLNQPLREYLSIKTELYEMIYECYSLENYDYYVNTMTEGLSYPELKSQVIKWLNMFKGGYPSKSEVMLKIVEIANSIHQSNQAGRYDIRATRPEIVRELRKVTSLGYRPTNHKQSRKELEAMTGESIPPVLVDRMEEKNNADYVLMEPPKPLHGIRSSAQRKLRDRCAD